MAHIPLNEDIRSTSGNLEGTAEGSSHGTVSANEDECPDQESVRGDGVMLSCTCRLYHLSIRVVLPDKRLVIFAGNECDDSVNTVYLGYANDHYVHLIPKVGLSSEESVVNPQEINPLLHNLNW